MATTVATKAMKSVPAFAASCPSRLILDQIADKWSVLILAALCTQPLRFNAIKRELEGITQKALTQTLRKLERNGIVARRVMPVSPVAVEYRITPLGQTLKVPFEALYRWTTDYLPQIEQARLDYDLRLGGDVDGQVGGDASGRDERNESGVRQGMAGSDEHDAVATEWSRVD